MWKRQKYTYPSVSFDGIAGQFVESKIPRQILVTSTTFCGSGRNIYRTTITMTSFTTQSQFSNAFHLFCYTYDIYRYAPIHMHLICVFAHGSNVRMHGILPNGKYTQTTNAKDLYIHNATKSTTTYAENSQHIFLSLILHAQTQSPSSIYLFICWTHFGKIQTHEDNITTEQKNATDSNEQTKDGSFLEHNITKCVFVNALNALCFLFIWEKWYMYIHSFASYYVYESEEKRRKKVTWTRCM